MKGLKWMKRYHNLQFFDDNIVGFFLRSAKNKNIASWIFSCQVACGNWPFVPRNLGKHLSLLMDLEL